ncbi:MAG: hypothetical protein ACOYOK_13655 [Pseudobdellovibrionaceae bacterium]
MLPRQLFFNLALVFSSCLIYSSWVKADQCVITVTRTACPGKEAESYSKCPGGSASCSEVLPDGAANPEDCAIAATRACNNKRVDITKNKSIVAYYDNQPLVNSKDFCLEKADSLFDPALSFPFRDKADCN